MRREVDDAVGFGRDVVATVREENVTFLAGSIAYNAFISLLPLLLLTVLAVSLFGGEGLRSWVVGAASSVAPSLESLIENRLLDGDAAGVSLVGLVTLLWGSLKLFRGLDTAFSEIYGTEDDGGLAAQVVDGLVVLLAIAAAIGATVLVTAVLALFPDLPALQYVDSLLLLAGLTLAFLPMYYVFPDVDVTLREVLPGAVVAAVGWSLLQGLFEVYLVLSGRSGEVGVFTGVIVLVTWLYFSGLVLLVGAVVNAVRGGHGRVEPPLVDPTTGRTLDRETAATYLDSLRAAFETGDREQVADVVVGDPDEVEIEEHEFVFGDGGERTSGVTVRWTDHQGSESGSTSGAGSGSDSPADD